MAHHCVRDDDGRGAGQPARRIRLHHVVDFIDIGVGNVRYWSFNVADSSFVVGVILLALYLSFKAEPAAEHQDERQRVV